MALHMIKNEFICICTIGRTQRSYIIMSYQMANENSSVTLLLLTIL